MTSPHAGGGAFFSGLRARLPSFKQTGLKQTGAAARTKTDGVSRAGAGAGVTPDDVRDDAENAAAGLPPLMVEAERLAHTVAAGVHGRRRAGPGETFWQHRPYAFGDAVSMIDWRQSARAASHLYVRQNEWEAAAAVWFWRDGSRSLDYASQSTLPTKRRRADVLALSTTLLLSEGGERVGLIGARPQPFHGRSAPALFLESLSQPAPFQMTPDGRGNGGDPDAADRRFQSTPPPITAGRGSIVVLISDFLCDLEPIADAVNHYAAQGATGLLVQVLDPAEITFPFSGRTEFLDLESDDRIVFGAAGSIADSYRNALADLQDDLRQLARSAGWMTQIHRTDAPANQALLEIYETLCEKKPV